MRIAAFVRRVFGRRTYTCPRCHARIPNTLAKCYRCGWTDAVTTANLEAQGGYLGAHGQAGPSAGIPGPL